jgi:hypothetical protein
MFSQCRHMPNVWNNTSEHAYGTTGRGTPGQLWNRGEERIWNNTESIPKGSMQWEHDMHVKAIREDTPMNDGYHAAMACMTAVLGREAAYCGQRLRWNDLVDRGRSYFPGGEITSFDQPAPVQPDADGFYESSVPVPGVYSPFA